MFVHNIDPILLSLGPLEIRYYGLIYALGFLITYYYLNWLSKKKKVPLSEEEVGQLVLYSILAVVIGARVFYVLVYNFALFASSPLSLFAVWNGGLSFHGGMLGLLGVIWWYTKKKKISFYDITDAVVLPAALALGLGRIANFINGELVGRITSVSWCVDYSQSSYVRGIDGCRHPSQLYESLYSFIIFAILWMLNKKNLVKGTLTWTFVLFYGLFRTLAESFRQPDPQLGFLIGGLTMGQLLSIPLIVIGAVMLWRLYKHD